MMQEKRGKVYPDEIKFTEKTATQPINVKTEEDIQPQNKLVWECYSAKQETASDHQNIGNLDLSVIHSEMNLPADETEKTHNQKITQMSILA